MTSPNVLVGTLTASQTALYQYAVDHGGLDPDAEAPGLSCAEATVPQDAKVLHDLCLLTPSGGSRRLMPVDPDTARILLTERVHREIQARERELERDDRTLRQLSAWMSHSSRGGEAVRVVRNPAQARALRNAAALNCTHEALTTVLGVEADPEVLDHAAEADATMGRRGVRRRWVCQNVSRSSLGMRAFFRTVQGNGGAVRTTSESFEAMSVFDRKIAFIALGGEDAEEPGACVVITSEPVVDFLRRVFERIWCAALPFEDERAAYESAVSDDRVLLIRLLASGLKDDAIAARLGVAVRTCRRHVANLLQDLDASSRFQAGVRVGQLDLLPYEAPRAEATTTWIDVHP